MEIPENSDKKLSPSMERFKKKVRALPKKGDRVKILRYAANYNGREGTVFSRDGQYIYVTVDATELEPSHIIEVYSSEIEILKNLSSEK